ncbi:MAG: alpha/beta hydrolase [Hellea sp.]
MTRSLVKKILTATIEGFELTATEFCESEHPNGVTLFCLPGGGASAKFFDLAPDFSFARNMIALGYRVITMDHPGTATNILPEAQPFFTPRQAADYIAAAMAQWDISGTVIGIGHSMGGMTITLLQARHAPFKAIGLFGSSAGGLEWGLSEDEKAYIDRPDDFARDLEKLTLGKFGRLFTEIPSGPSGKSITFGGETPELTQHLRDISCELYTAGGMMSMMRGSFRAEVEAINVPMFFAFGDHDIGIPPQDAPKDYINAPSTELVVLENTGHNHFAFSSIETLCEKLDHWASNVA